MSEEADIESPEIEPGVSEPAVIEPVVEEARQNIALLRFARALDMVVNWNLLYGFPGDDEADYRQTLDLAPLLTHLNPPSGFSALSIDRFSPYHEAPESFGIAGVQPMPAYADIYPAQVDLAALAYHFVGDYETAARRAPDLVDAVTAAVEAWRAAWFGEGAVPPTLAVSPVTADTFVIVDTRPVAVKHVHLVDAARALAALSESAPGDPAAAWAIANKVAVRIGDIVVPLATTDAVSFAEMFDARAEARQSELAA